MTADAVLRERAGFCGCLCRVQLRTIHQREFRNRSRPRHRADQGLSDGGAGYRRPLSSPGGGEVHLKIGESTTAVTVTEAGDLLETDPTSHTDVDRALFDKLPLESASSSLSSLVTMATPGVAADSNGVFHGPGDHASNSFSVGQPITDQQSKVFSNQVPVDSVQSMEVIEGAPPAEFGGKTSLVIVVTTRSGLGATTPHGDVTASYGLRQFQRRFGSRLRAAEMGKFHLRQRTEYRPLSRWSRISGVPRPRQ